MDGWRVDSSGSSGIVATPDAMSLGYSTTDAYACGLTCITLGWPNNVLPVIGMAVDKDNILILSPTSRAMNNIINNINNNIIVEIPGKSQSRFPKIK